MELELNLTLELEPDLELKLLKVELELELELEVELGNHKTATYYLGVRREERSAASVFGHKVMYSTTLLCTPPVPPLPVLPGFPIAFARQAGRLRITSA